MSAASYVSCSSWTMALWISTFFVLASAGMIIDCMNTFAKISTTITKTITITKKKNYNINYNINNNINNNVNNNINNNNNNEIGVTDVSPELEVKFLGTPSGSRGKFEPFPRGDVQSSHPPISEPLCASTPTNV